jgi:hypothetical protein
MAYSDVFFAKKDSIIPKASYIKLQQYYVPQKSAVHLFVENDDDFEFYRTTINYVYRDYETYHYPMQGKKNLKDGYKEIDWKKFNRAKVLFFADKDYDDILNIERLEESNFFYTKYYSIENYLVSSEVFDIVLNRFFTPIDDSTKEKLHKLYNVAYASFIEKMRTLTSFILIDREKSKRADLDEFKMSYFIHFEAMEYMEKKLISNFSYHKIIRDSKSTPLQKNLLRNMSIKEILAKKCNADEEIFTFNEIMAKKRVIAAIGNHKIFVRGKYDLWFFLEIIKSTDKAIKRIYDSGGRKVTDKEPLPKKKIDISDKNIFDLLCSKVLHPVDVKTFLMNNYNSLNGHN